ncbi:hypothetical protein FKG94_05530 [Exilibacterium tricleocarpae]|uniref:Flagellar brake protein n=1 Tax=Exilibacterium tricleocarpae TaxID=2591008 RepID=A0A545U3V9_9GAMM|nr:flagellar brake protein [Exilibacterium tricleocarpae]TQV84124.1 hypothetical protein FKG94_05530 [Exilibacterium tricleocarpae]
MNTEDGGEQITNVQDIYRTLKSLQLARSQLTVKINGDRQSYASMVMHVDLQRRRFTIDELVAGDANRRVAAGQPFTIIAFYEGVKVILKGKSAGGGRGQTLLDTININFPAYIYHKQRRQAFRAPLAADTPSGIRLLSGRRHTALHGRIIDLSTTGVGCEFTKPARLDIDKHEHFDRCTINIGDEFELHCHLIARSPGYQRLLDRYTCGFAFTLLDRHQQKALDRYVLAIQRRARKARSQRRAVIASVA